MPHPQEGPKHQSEKRNQRALQERAFSDAGGQFLQAVDAYIAKHPNERVQRKAAEQLQAMTLKELEDLSGGKREYLMGLLLQLHQQVTGSEYKARLSSTMRGVLEITRALDTLTDIFGLKDEFTKKAIQEQETEKENDATNQFFKACVDMKREFPDWSPPTHPKHVLTAATEQQLDFADSLAEAVQAGIDHKGFVDRQQLLRVFNIFEQLDPQHKLNLKKQHARLYKQEAQAQKMQAELAAYHRAEQEERRKYSAEEYMTNVELMYADLISSTDIVVRYRQTDPNDRQAYDKLLVEASDAIHTRMQKRPRIAELLSKHSESSDLSLATNVFVSNVIGFLVRDNPYQPPQKKSLLSWFRKKEPAPLTQPDTARYGEQMVAKAVDALYAEYKSHYYTATGGPGRSEQEMAANLIKNPEAAAYLKDTLQLPPQASDRDVHLAVQKYLFDALKRRGL